MFIRLTSLAFLVSCALPAVARSSNDSKLLQGVWVPVKWELGGAATPPSTMPGMKLILTGGAYEFVEGPSHDVGKLTLRPDKKPKEMDIVGVKGPNAGRTIPAIYRFDGGRVVICYGLDLHRPKSFVSPKKSLILLVTFAHPLKKP